MAHRRIQATSIDFADLRRELELPSQFPPAAQAQAEQAAAQVRLPERDRTDLAFVTIDPPTSLDLDQAVCLLPRPTGGGYRVHYAIADVLSYVSPGSPLDEETWLRGQTVYLPDGNIPLHPRVLSEGAVSLLPDSDRAAVVWSIDLSRDGEVESVSLERARVRSRAKLNYAGVQSDADKGTLPPSIELLPRIGRLLSERALARGSVSLPMPAQEVERDGDGWRLVLRPLVPAEEWNAQISLLTGCAAAQIMLEGKIGLLRTMPAPPEAAIEKLRVAAAGLGVPWPDGKTVGQVLASLGPASPKTAAFVDEAAELLRGAGYTAFSLEAPDEPAHAAVAAPYAHVTAPLRRLADRYATEVCLALFEGREVPQAVAEALPKLPGVMASTDRVAGTADRAAIDLVEATVLEQFVGQTFPAVVLDSEPDRSRATIALDDPAVRARCDGRVEAGTRITARLTVADPVKRQVRFAAA
ncbi:RNB domain-containing ribonuclease [Allorhizocola rhizosphaerae]|uniref:RNB domain-containing ribonuclease n=1 Tax=Allorhizocola rhizosphaerae TaxID=1872709 RepID=UPI000E3C9F8A|nr:RNB domain-containing ribonuclease [Allorhizocola rhizosphaerae]